MEEEVQSNKKLLAPRFLLPMGAVLALVSIFLFYYFLIISRQEASLDDRAFRSLAAVSGQMRDLVSNYAEVMQRSEGFSQDDFRTFVAEQVPDLKIDDKCPAPGPSIRPTLGGDGDGLEFVASKACGHVLVGTAVAPLLGGPSREIFDEVLLATSKGRVLYQTQTAGAVANDLAPFLQGGQGRTQNAGQKETPNSPVFAAASQSSNLGTISLGGNTYRAYLVPVPLTTNEAGDAPDKLVLELVGLIRQERFRAAGRSVPGTALTSLVLTVVLVIVATWPLLKFSKMRLTERIPRNAGLYYALSSTATIVLMTVLVIDIRYVFYDSETDENLKKLAATIDGNLGRELGQALRVMNGIAGSSYYKEESFQDHSDIRGTGCTRAQKDPPTNVQTSLLKLPGMQLAEYPYFRRFFAYDGYGFEQMKWTVDPTVPPSLRVCDRPYFIGAMRNQLWHLKDDISGPHFRVDPIYSKLTGEYLAVIAEPPAPDPAARPKMPRVLTMVTPLLSLIRPVLPPDYGFAVIDESGKVLFHSEAAKNGRENFFDETSDAAELRAAIAARRQALLSVNYSGFTHRVFVAPLSSVQHSPWYLITFSNLSTAHADLVDRLVLFSALVLIYLALIIVPCALVLMLLRPNRVLWIWPTPDKRGCYHHLILTFIVVLPLFYALVFRSNAWQLLAFTVLVPVLSALFAFFKLTSRDNWIQWTALALPVMGLITFLNVQGAGRDFYPSFLLICSVYFFLSLKPVTERLHRWEPWPFLTSFGLGCFCLVVIAAAVPCIALFKTAYDYEENMATRREQLLTMQALEAREERVIQQYLNVKISNQQLGYADDIAKWLFLRRRLEDEKLDVYDKVFQDQQSAQIFKPGGPLEHEEPPWLLSWLAARLPFSAGSLTNNLSQNAAEGSQWEWDNEGTNRIRIHPLYDPKIESHGGSPQTLALAKRVFRDPVFLTQELAYDLEVLQPWPFFLAVVPLLLLLLVGMYYSVRSTLQKMFLIGMDLPNSLPELSLNEAVTPAGNLILLGLPCSEKSRMLELERSIAVVDLALFLQGKQDAPDAASATVALDHFEFDMDDDAANSKKLELLEQLVRNKQRVLIVTTIDPLFYLESVANGSVDTSAAGRERSRTLQRWGRVLADFAKYRLKARPATCSKACYRLLWSTCTRNERAALYGLAHDGWANYKNYAALEHLWQRGLIQRALMFQIAGEYAGFAEFISGAVTREERNGWDVLHVPGVFDWDGLKAMLLVMLTGTVAVVLFFNQQEVLGYITGAISTVLPLAKLLTDMRGSRGGPQGKAQGESA